MTDSGSFFSFAMSLTNTARSKSHPAACSRWSSDQFRSASIAPTVSSVWRV